MIANVSFSSFQPMTAPGKLFKRQIFKDTFLSVYCFSPKEILLSCLFIYLFIFYFLVSLIKVHFDLHVKEKHD